MDYRSFKSWLDRYSRALEKQDFTNAEHIFGDLFTDDATYQVTPFSESHSGRAAIISYGLTASGSQEHMRFDYEILAVTDELGIAHWWASFLQIPSREDVKLDGIFVVTLNQDGQCTRLREWWHSQHNKAD